MYIVNIIYIYSYNYIYIYLLGTIQNETQLFFPQLKLTFDEMLSLPGNH